ncbi:hypothetical protein [Kitasatospora sp. NPDC090091]|uniref:hypothetical protein n=1 Tax=Kitasatospora sp. NPDC090091 TaxID=3364081 RepID=UPI003802E41D
MKETPVNALVHTLGLLLAALAATALMAAPIATAPVRVERSRTATAGLDRTRPPRR